MQFKIHPEQGYRDRVRRHLKVASDPFNPPIIAVNRIKQLLSAGLQPGNDAVERLQHWNNELTELIPLSQLGWRPHSLAERVQFAFQRFTAVVDRNALRLLF